MTKSSSSPAAASRSASTASSSSAASSTSAFGDNNNSSGSSGGNGNGSIPTALPTHEAMRILLSPDGYYEYLGIPKPTSAEMDAFLGSKFTNNNNSEASAASSSSIDLEKVKKNYRRLSLKHHPDRKSGNAEAFRMLNRAKIVLSNSKLRREYDLLGLDLDDDAEDDEVHVDEGETVVTTTVVGRTSGEEGRTQDDDHVTSGRGDDDDGGDIDANNNNSNNSTNNANEGAHRRRPTKSSSNKSNAGGNDSSNSNNSKSNNNSGTGGGGSGSSGGGGSKPDTVMGHLASASLAAVLQVVVRTGLMGVVSVLISRYTILTFLAIGTLAFLSYKLYTSLKKTLSASNVKMAWSIAKESLSPIVIAFGIYCMYRGRRYVMATPESTTTNSLVLDTIASEEVGIVAAAAIAYLEWSWTFWLGETIVMTSFLCNSFEKQTRGLIAGFAVLSLLLSLWLRGKFWRYCTLLGLEAFVAMLIVIVFPIMEMILESIVEEKMRKVGEKIRAHDRRMKELLRKERERAGSESR